MSRSGFDWSSWGSISRNRQDERDISSTSLAFCSRACNHRCQLRRPRDSFLSYPRSELARFAYKKRKGFVLWGIPPSPSTLVWKSDKAHVWPVFRFRRGRRNVVVAISFERRWKMENPLFRMLILWKIRAPPPPSLSLCKGYAQIEISSKFANAALCISSFFASTQENEVFSRRKIWNFY